MKQVQYSGFELDHFDSAINFRHYQLSLFKKYLNDDFLEVGAGKGGLAIVYKELLRNITLIEPDKILFKILKKKIKDKNVSIENKSIKNIKKKFNTIIYFDVLEHIKNDLFEVKTASKKLNSGGYLIFSVPAHQIFYSDFDKSVGHFKRYNQKDFRVISEKCGLKIEKILYYDSIGFLLLIINKIFSLGSGNLKLKISLWNFLIPISRIIDFLTFYKFGKSLICVFKKKR